TLLEERNEFAKVGVIYASIAVLFSEIGDHDTAIDLNMKAMDYYRDYMDENPRQMATAMMNSGTAHHRAGRHEQAIEAYEKAAEYQKAVASDWLNGILNFNWARALYKLGNREAAIARGETALGQIAELRDPDEAAVAMSWLAERYIEDGRMDDAEKLLDEAQSIMEPPGSQRLTERDGDGSKLRQLQYSRATAHVLMGLGRTGEAQRYTEAAFMLGDQRYEAEKVRALANAKLVVELRDRENDLAIARQQELLADSELSQAQLRIALLIAAAALASLFAVFLWRSSRAQRAHIATKDMLLSEIHHRTKNNLQVLISLLNLDARRRGREEGASATSRDAANRARAMALVHDHIYQKTDSIDIDGRQFLADLLELLQRSLGHPGIRVTSHLCDVKIDADTATPLGLLVSEVITNAYKYAFPDGRAGELRVVFEPGNGGLTLRITDDGVGFDVNSSPRRSGSLGFDLIADLTAKLGARHEVMSGNGGTTWVFSRIEPRLGRKSEDRSLVSVSH
ncbi:MAG: histidine kinase dimerization/phosphoacceptor domain -containing protein, partial [Pseudomonadota bacterium]